MSNLAKFSLNELEVDEIYVTDVLKCLLHTIVFQRCLGEITPSESECENLPDLHYPSAEIDAVNKEIDDSVKKFVDSLADVSKQIKQRILNDEQQQQASGNNNNNNSSSNNRTKIYSAHQQFTIELGFYSVKKISYFLRTVEEKSDYEKWIIPLKILFYFDNHHTNNTNTSTNNTLSTSTTSNNNKNTSIATPNTTTTNTVNTTNTTTTMTTITTNKRGSLEVNPHRFSRNRSSSFHKQSVSRLMESVEQRMKTIIIESHQKIDHLPIVKMDEIPKFFPFRITLPTLTKGGGLWTGSLMDLVGFN